MTNTSSKTETKTVVVPEFKPKKLSPFVSDPFNTRGGKAGKGGAMVSTNVGKSGSQMNVAPKRKGGSGGDR